MEDVKCIIDVKSEPLEESDGEDPLAPRPSDYRFIKEHFNKTKQSDIKLEQPTEILKREDVLSGVIDDDCIIIDHKLEFNDDTELPSSGEACIDVSEEDSSRTSEQSVCGIYSETNFDEQLKSEILKRESDLSGVNDDDCTIIDHKLELNDDLELPSSGEAGIEVSDEDTNRTPGSERPVSREISETNDAEQLKINEVQKYLCCYCDFRSANILLVSKHRTSVHKDIVPFTCTRCGYRAKNAGSLNAHVTNVHRRKRLLKCTRLNCDYTSGDLYALRKHVSDVHKPTKTYSCSRCEFKVTSMKTMLKHQRLHPKLTYSCEQCDYKTKIIYHLKRHIQSVHDKMKPFTCSLCDYKSKQSNHLKTHVLAVHRKVKPFKCDQCEYEAAHLHHLKNHVKAIHDKFKEYSCNHCEYKACFLKQLKRHVAAIHEN